MESNAVLEITQKVYESRTNFWGRVFHGIGDSMLVCWPASYLSAYLCSLTGLRIFNSQLYYIGVLLIYYFVMESLFQRTLFKILTGSIVVTEKGDKPKGSSIFIRSLIRFIPFEQISLLFTKESERWWHDVWTKTYVVKNSKLKSKLTHEEPVT